MKYLKIFEDFKEEDIHEICRKYDITDYTINNGIVDVDGSVHLYNRSLVKLPIKFGRVTGNFICNCNELTSLIGCPIYVGGEFNCFDNKLTTLEGCPKYVGNFFCTNNDLTSLEGCPIEIKGDFHCCLNKLTNLIGGPKEVSGNFDCSINDLTSLEGCPNKLGGKFYCSNNPVGIIYIMFGHNYELFLDSLDYNYFRGGNKINKIRLTQALEEIREECPENIKGYVWE